METFHIHVELLWENSACLDDLLCAGSQGFITARIPTENSLHCFFKLPGTLLETCYKLLRKTVLPISYVLQSFTVYYYNIPNPGSQKPHYVSYRAFDVPSHTHLSIIPQQHISMSPTIICQYASWSRFSRDCGETKCRVDNCSSHNNKQSNSKYPATVSCADIYG